MDALATLFASDLFRLCQYTDVCGLFNKGTLFVTDFAFCTARDPPTPPPMAAATTTTSSINPSQKVWRRKPRIFAPATSGGNGNTWTCSSTGGGCGSRWSTSGPSP
ncbi:hypothetical protein AA0113_g3536 [Alternaria arborescens]|uniref:Uncharacterized protein n=1 Tax=Alternaria arborescens TaxID=156630 RepID=A0A4Q4SHM0_9PLEO|nr:hypothetical protein AA0113_g3536 [Alternaria arborescens]